MCYFFNERLDVMNLWNRNKLSYYIVILAQLFMYSTMHVLLQRASLFVCLLSPMSLDVRIKHWVSSCAQEILTLKCSGKLFSPSCLVISKSAIWHEMAGHESRQPGNSLRPLVWITNMARHSIGIFIQWKFKTLEFKYTCGMCVG